MTRDQFTEEQWERLDAESKAFIQTMDLMIESTEEFIRDDEVTPTNDPEGRLEDLKCLEHVRQLFAWIFATED